MARYGAFARTRAGWAAGLAPLSVNPPDPEKQSEHKFSLWTVDCELLTDRRGGTAKKQFFFCTSNAGMSLKTKDRCGKVGRKRECL
jgi:hypothetical protein